MFRLSTGRLYLFYFTYCAHRKAEEHNRYRQQATYWTAKESHFSSLNLPEIILFCTVHGPALELTEPRIKWLSSSVFSELRRPGRGTEPLPPSTSVVKKEWSYILSPHIPLWRVQGQNSLPYCTSMMTASRWSCSGSPFSFCMQAQTPGNRNATRWTVQIWLRMACTETDCSSSGRRQLCVPWRETSNLTLREIERYNVHMCHWLVVTVMVWWGGNWIEVQARLTVSRHRTINIKVKLHTLAVEESKWSDSHFRRSDLAADVPATRFTGEWARLFNSQLAACPLTHAVSCYCLWCLCWRYSIHSQQRQELCLLADWEYTLLEWHM